VGVKEKIPGVVFFAAACISAVATLLVFCFMLLVSYPVLLTKGFLINALTSPWSPHNGQFGIGPMIAGTLYIAFLSLLIAFPLSLGCSIFIENNQSCTKGRLLKKIVQLMTAVPTVIYGFVGVFLLVPIVRQLFVSGSGMCILSASLMLALLISPTMILFFSQSFAMVPKTYLNAVDALGSNGFQKFFYVILPNAWQGILTGLVLGFGRAMGDTLIALMLSGNSVMLPTTLLGSARTLTSHIALIIAADFDSIEFKILFLCGIILYLMTSSVMIMVRYFDRRQA